MFKRDIKTVNHLETALKKVYDRTHPEIIHDYLSKEGADTGQGRVHTIKGCDDCPFVREIKVDENHSHAFCLWDGSKSDISSFIGDNGLGTPADCPLQSSNITTTLNGNS